MSNFKIIPTIIAPNLINEQVQKWDLPKEISTAGIMTSIRTDILTYITKYCALDLVRVLKFNKNDLIESNETTNDKVKGTRDYFGNTLRYEYKNNSNTLYQISDNVYEYHVYKTSPEKLKKYNGKKVNGMPEYDGYIKLLQFEVVAC